MLVKINIDTGTVNGQNYMQMLNKLTGLGHFGFDSWMDRLGRLFTSLPPLILKSPETMNILLNIHFVQSKLKGQRGPVFNLPSTRVQHKLPGAATIGWAIQWIKNDAFLGSHFISSSPRAALAQFSTSDSPKQKPPTVNGAST